MALEKKNNHLITEDVFFLLDRIEGKGYPARLVGGAVRNWLLNIEPTDIDIATAAPPAETMRIFEAVDGARVVPTGIDYGTITVAFGGKSYEITSLRKDVQTFGRKAIVQFSDSFVEDSQRRDFTINAIYVDKNENIFDYHNGMEDISQQNIRFIGCPEDRLREDFLRILRYFRFVVCYGRCKINEEYLALINGLKDHITLLSSERILAELLKMLAVNDSHRIIPAMKPVLDVLFDLDRDPLEVVCQLNIFAEMTAVERLGLLLKFSRRRDLKSRYNFPRLLSRMISLDLVADIDLGADMEVGADNCLEPVLRRRLKGLPGDLRHFFICYAAVLSATCSGNVSVVEILGILRRLEDFCRHGYADFPLRAADLGELPPTKLELNELMKATKHFWLTADQTVGREECRQFALDYGKKLNITMAKN
ncbi:MAG: hypothetical protein LBJ16_04000 [Holosporaceae bacterium]|jgi:hypothetical protein|nr:hypothetical protein [Holosporaceae bacterium]